MGYFIFNEKYYAMGSSSTHAAQVTKRMMARKRAKRAARKERKALLYRGKFGDVKENRLADRFRTKKGHLVEERAYLTATEKAFFWMVLVAVVIAVTGLYFFG